MPGEREAEDINLSKRQILHLFCGVLLFVQNAPKTIWSGWRRAFSLRTVRLVNA